MSKEQYEKYGAMQNRLKLLEDKKKAISFNTANNFKIRIEGSSFPLMIMDKEQFELIGAVEDVRYFLDRLKAKFDLKIEATKNEMEAL